MALSPNQSNRQSELFYLQIVKETGTLKKLVALITDQAPPEDEAKGSGGKGGKEKAGSRAAKKSAKDGRLCVVNLYKFRLE